MGILLIVLGLLGNTSTLSAQQQNGPTTITLQDALNYALQNNDALRKARLEIEGGRLKVAEVRASAIPQVDVISTLTNNLLVQQFILPGEIFGGNPGEFIAVEAGQTWNAMTQVQLNQQLFNQQVFTGLKAAKSSEEFYILSAKLSEENLIQQVATNYYQVIITREQLGVIDANLDRIDQLEKMVDNQYNVGLAKKIDLDRIRVNKSNLLAQREQLQSAVVMQENLLKYYMGMPVTESILIPEREIANLEQEAHLTLDQEKFNAAKMTSFQLLKKQEDLLQLQKKAYFAEYYPSLSLGANYMYSSQSNQFNVYSGKSLSYDVAAVSLNLRIPIFDGGARRSRVRQSEIDLQKVQEDIRGTSNALTMAYENAKIQIRNSLTTIDMQKTNKDFAEEVFNSTRNNYQNGLASLTDLLTAETDLVTAQNSYNQALLNYKVAEIELIKSNGNIRSLVRD
ncbi:MAG TPA: TolC family protein [Sphingobacteriaceae bacterium]|nr:TolC family protein [Sphingobacteriaceae bacterium]